MSRIRSVQLERRELAYKMVRCLPDLYMRVVCHRDEASIWRESHSVYWLLEVDLMQHRPPAEVHEQSAAVLIDRDEHVAVGAQSNGRDILAVLKWESVGFVTIARR